jgi:hypothetical protein
MQTSLMELGLAASVPLLIVSKKKLCKKKLAMKKLETDKKPWN